MAKKSKKRAAAPERSAVNAVTVTTAMAAAHLSTAELGRERLRATTEARIAEAEIEEAQQRLRDARQRLLNARAEAVGYDSVLAARGPAVLDVDLGS